jgi:nitrate reductase molybdenum cofactor assembly chaperone NarJ/NarW
MALSFKVLSALLTYPTAELQASADALRAMLDLDAIVPPTLRNRLDILIDEIAGGDLYDLQERYTLLFDRTRSLSLYLFEHVHGESRDRGQAMVDLAAMYEQHGLALAGHELPDFIPLFLEFLATVPQREAYDLLSQPAHILAALAERLRKRRSSYESVFRALVALAASKPKGNEVEALLSLPDPDPDDLVALDAAWEDEPVNFGPGAGDNCKDGLVSRMRAARRPAPGMPEPARTAPVVTRA